jgi:hypothetical protein
MYGGSGNRAVALEVFVEAIRSVESQAKKRPSRATTVARASPGSSSTPPECGGWLARSWNTASFAPSARSSKQLDLAARRAQRVQPRLDDPRVVEHDQIAAREKPRQLGESMIVERCAATCSSRLPARSRPEPARSARAAAHSRNRTA